MTTAQTLIDEAAGMLGVKAAGQPMDGGESADFLSRVNSIIDSWRTESLFAYARQRVTGNLPANTATLTIGPTGNIVTPYRPIRLENGSFYTMSGVDFSLAVYTEAEYNSVSQKTLATQGPNGIYYEAGLPNGTLYFYPRAGSAVVLTLLTLTELVEFPTLNSDFTLPPGYRLALAGALAEEMQGDYGKQLSQMKLKRIYVAKRNIRRANMIVPKLSYPWNRSTNANDLFLSPERGTFDGGSA